MQLSDRLVPLGAAFFAGVAIMALLGLVAASTFGRPPHPVDLAGIAVGTALAVGLWAWSLKRQA